MAETVKIDRKQIQLTLNKLTKEQYDELVRLSADSLSGELSDQLFLTTGDAEPYCPPPPEPVSLSGYALLSADNVFTGKNTFTAISAKINLPEDSALSNKTLMLSDGSGSYNVGYDRLSATDTQYGTIKVAVVDKLPDPLLPDVFYFVKEN